MDTPSQNDLRTVLEAVRQVRVLVVGDIILDHYVWGDAVRLSPEAPVPVVHAERDTFRLGGAGNVALNLRALGVSTALAGVVGDDEYANRCQQLLREAEVDSRLVAVSGTARTILKMRVVARNQQLLRVDREDVPSRYAFDAAKLDGGEANAVVLSDYAKGVVTEKLAQSVLSQAKDKLVAYDPKPSRTLAVSGIGLMTPNRPEALSLAGLELHPQEPFPAEAVCARLWEEYRPHYLVVTLGAEGMLLAEEGQIVGQVPAYAREVFDVSGAGDTVIAALTAALASGASLLSAAHLANTAAGIVVAKFGTATASPEEILAWHERV